MYSRTRTRNTPKSLFMTRTLGASTLSGTAEWTESETMKDNLTVGFFAKRKGGAPLPVNPMEHTKKRLFLEHSPMTGIIRPIPPHLPSGPISIGGNIALGDFYTRRGSSWWSSGVLPGTLPDWPNSNGLLIEALGKARTHSWDFGTFVAEGNKVADLVLRFHQRVRRRASTIRKRYPKASANEFASAWLEYRYGWRILGYDIQEMSEAWDRFQSSATPPARYTVRREEVNVISNRSFSSSGYNTFSGRGTLTPPHDGTEVWELFREVRAGVGIEMVSRRLAFMDPLVTAWEIVPFSFIVDWFTNLGELTEAYSPFVNSKVLWGFVTREEGSRQTVRSIMRGNHRVGNDTSGTDYTIHTVHPHTMVKTVSTLVRIPQVPKFEMTLRTKLDALKLIDLVALAPGIGRRLRRFLR